MDSYSTLRRSSALLLALAACGEAGPTELRVGYIPIPECLPLYVAQERGYFAQEGLEVSLTGFDGGSIILNALETGALDVGFSNVVSLASRHTARTPFVSVYGATYETTDQSNHALLARSGPVDWRGAAIAVNTRLNIEELMARRYLRTIGVDPRDVAFIAMPFGQMLGALGSGSADVVAVVEHFITEGVNEGNVLVARHYLDQSQRTLVATYVALDSLAGGEPETIEKFRRAMRAATDAVRAAQEEGRVLEEFAELLREYTSVPDGMELPLPEFADAIDASALGIILQEMASDPAFAPSTPLTTDSLIAR